MYVLLCSVPFDSVRPCSRLFRSVPFVSVSFCSAWVGFIPFRVVPRKFSALFRVPFRFVPFRFDSFRSIIVPVCFSLLRRSVLCSVSFHFFGPFCFVSFLRRFGSTFGWDYRRPLPTKTSADPVQLMVVSASVFPTYVGKNPISADAWVPAWMSSTQITTIVIGGRRQY